MKNLVKIKYFFLPSFIIFHLSLIYARGYFLSGEFTTYPYLVSRGFLPYRDILDQHFPTLLFGPFSLPAILTTNPWPLLGLFFATLCLTDIFLFATFVRYKIKNPFLWLALYIVSSVYFSGFVLWIETFVNLLFSLWLFLSFSQNNLRRFVSGLLLSQILLLRPTIAPALIIILFSLSGLSWALVIGGFIGLAIPAIFIIKQGIAPDFYRLAIQFNQQIYPTEARIFPGKRQIITLLLWLSPVTFSVIKNKKYLFLVILICLLPLAFPRFGYEHLQPLYLFAILFWALSWKRSRLLVHFFVIILFCLNIISAIHHPYGNFYLTPEVQETATKLKVIPGQEIYLLGAPDILYSLSGKIPPYYTYVPSLPWYLHQKDFQNKIITSLKMSRCPILVDFQAEVDNKNVVNESQNIIKYIKINYTVGVNIGNYQLFTPKL